MSEQETRLPLELPPGLAQAVRAAPYTPAPHAGVAEGPVTEAPVVSVPMLHAMAHVFASAYGSSLANGEDAMHARLYGATAALEFRKTIRMLGPDGDEGGAL